MQLLLAGLATADTGPDTDWDWDTPPLDKHSQTNIAGPSTALALNVYSCIYLVVCEADL